jgi:hypothetical protein
MDIQLIEFFSSTAIVCAVVGLVLNWVPLVRSFKGNQTPEHGPLLGIVLWATLVPISCYWWVVGLPQMPVHVGGVLLSTLMLGLCMMMVTIIGWRESRAKVIQRWLPKGALDDRAQRLKSWAAFAVLMLASWLLMGNMEVALRLQ